MDIPRKSAKRNKRVKQTFYILTALIVLIGITFGVSRLKPAIPTVDKGTLWTGDVKRGSMLRQVRGLGTLVPEEIRYVPTISQGRVEKRLVQPGAAVKQGTLLFELSNPEVQQAALDSESQLRGAEANLATLRVQLQKLVLDQRATLAQVTSDYKKAQMQYEVNTSLGKQGLKPELEVKLSEIAAADADSRVKLETQRLAATADENKARLAAEEEKVRQLRDAVKLKRQQVAQLQVRAGIDGVVQTIEVQVGQQVTPGFNLARVANPLKLKAELKIAETQTKDIQIGQPVSVDTRNGIIPGRVTRIDPSVQNGTRTVDAELLGDLPKGAVADLSVDGTIQLEKLDDILYVGRPVHGQENSKVLLFKLEDGGTTAIRVPVTLGRSSVNTIEVLEGLREGDRVILSDTSSFDDKAEQIRLN
ncbi:MAG: HlyD family efflux transporter periplasmic adaptor subunit [Acidobacteriota bacterium]